jgi:hypothetical protein
LAAIVSQPPPTIHGPQPPNLGYRRGAGIVNQTLRRLEQAPDVQSGVVSEVQAEIIVGAGMSRAAGPRSPEHERYDARDGGENGRQAFQKRIRCLHRS